MNYQKTILAGNAVNDAERYKSKKGNVVYTKFNVGVSDTKGRTIFFPVVVFGKYGMAISKHVIKGRLVLVDGRIEVTSKGHFNIIADQVRLGTSSGKPAKKSRKAK